MRKIKIKEVQIKTDEGEYILEYSLILKGEKSGIEVRERCSGRIAARFVPDTVERVYELLIRYARHTVMPETLKDLVDDYVYERWLC